MPTATLKQFFGATATVNATVLTIDLDDFVSVGLTPSSTSPTEILTAILLMVKAAAPLETAQQDKEWGLTVGEPFLSVVRDNEQLERQFPVSVYTPFSGGSLDPDDVVG